MSLYRCQDWLRFRALCIENADGACQNCGDDEILQVHHPKYIKGRRPWEYPVEFCVVLCRRCHAKEHGLILPSEGWIIVDNDLERNHPSNPVPCARCQRTVTWHFHVFHPEWGDTIFGSECAESLSIGPEAVVLKSYRRRLVRFLSSVRWRQTPKGTMIFEPEARILIFKNALNTFDIKINDKFGVKTYKTLVAAKHQAFDVMEHRRKKKKRMLKRYCESPF